MNSYIPLLLMFNFVYGGLYNKNDDVAVLDNDNFYDIVLGKDHAWIIQFYNTWCGHCQHFAPLYKKLALDMTEWKHTVLVAVIDCAEDKNSGICRDYEVTGYPTIKVFGANLQKGDFGITMPSELAAGDTESIEKFLLKILTKMQAAGNGSKTWNNLQYFKGNISDARTAALQSSQMTVVILEPRTSIVGRQVILDLNLSKQVRVIRINQEDNLVSAIMVFGDGQQKNIISNNTNRQLLKESIVHQLHLSRRETSKNGEEFSLKYDTIANVSNRMHMVTEEDGQVDQVYLVDIENALSYLFRHELILHKIIEGHNLIALIDFVDVLYFCLPARSPVHKFMENFYYYASNKISLSGEHLLSIYENLTSERSFLPRQHQWVGCLGSEERYRGFTCGLWTMFHVLTVNPCLTDDHGRSKKAIEVLESIHGFIKYFFTCRECSGNFQKMYAVDAREFVYDRNDAITWLWLAHNRVNHRLGNKVSEDPFHKKKPFPSRLKCPSCWINDIQFNEAQILKYLNKIYGSVALSTNGMVKQASLKRPENFYQSYLTYYSWYSFAALYLVSSTFLVICFLLFVGAFKRHPKINNRYHIL